MFAVFIIHSKSDILALDVVGAALAHADTGHRVCITQMHRPVVSVARDALPEEAHVLALHAEGRAEVAEDAAQRLVCFHGDRGRLEIAGMPQQHALRPDVVVGPAFAVRRGRAQRLALVLASRTARGQNTRAPAARGGTLLEAPAVVRARDGMVS